jgi:hypothetical protein
MQKQGAVNITADGHSVKVLIDNPEYLLRIGYFGTH